jgi:transcription elongation factor SPT6
MDTPERMQLATSSLSENSTLSLHTQLTEEDIGGAAMWVSQRLPPSKKENSSPKMGSITISMEYWSWQSLSFCVSFSLTNTRSRISGLTNGTISPTLILKMILKRTSDLLELEELWLVYSLGQKYRSLLERRRALAGLYQRLQVRDAYYDDDIEPQLDSVEIVADATEWLSMKYKDKKQDPAAEFRFHDDEEPELGKEAQDAQSCVGL